MYIRAKAKAIFFIFVAAADALMQTVNLIIYEPNGSDIAFAVALNINEPYQKQTVEVRSCSIRTTREIWQNCLSCKD